MNLGLFNELLEALERVGQHIMTAARLPKKRRAELLQVLSDTYEMLDRVLLMVIGRIGRVLDRAERGAREEFAVELSKLAWDSEWLDATREMSISWISSACGAGRSRTQSSPTGLVRHVSGWLG